MLCSVLYIVQANTVLDVKVEVQIFEGVFWHIGSFQKNRIVFDTLSENVASFSHKISLFRPIEYHNIFRFTQPCSCGLIRLCEARLKLLVI